MASTDDSAPGIPVDPDLPPGGPDRVPLLTRSNRGHQAPLLIVIALGLGGSVGALGRYAIGLGLPSVSGQFPWATFITNVSGSAVLGFLLICLIEQFPRGRLARPVLGTGVIGAYTTFSTYMVDTVLLIRAGDIGTALVYLVASALLGLAALWGGISGARLVLRAERWLQREIR